VDPASVAEANLGFCRMHIHIDIGRRNIQHQNRGGIPARFGQSAEGFAQGVLDKFVANVPAIEIEELVLGGGPGQFGQADDATEASARHRGR